MPPPASRWNLLWAMPWMLITWLPVEVFILLPLYLLGLPTVALASRFAKREQGVSVVTGGSIIQWANPILDEWIGNHEDGIMVPGYTPWTWFLRNPVCNMRFWPVISTRPSLHTHYVGTASEIGLPGWFVAWAGPYVGFYYQNAAWGLWLAWKINPRDARPDAPKDYRSFGLGTACQRLSGVSA